MADPGPLWTRMNAQPRHHPEGLRAKLPIDPGVYAWYRRGRAIYVGKADSLLARVGKHTSKGRSMRGSAFRRNVAEHLGIASALAIYLGDYEPTEKDLAEIRAFIEGCRVAWLIAPSEKAAKDLEDDFKVEWMPPLTKQ